MFSLVARRSPAASFVFRFFSSQSNGSSTLDPLALIRRLEGQGLSSQQAEAIASVTADTLSNLVQSFAAKGDLLRSEKIEDGNISKFLLEMKISEDLYFASLKRNTKELRAEMERMGSEHRWETDKIRNKIDHLQKSFSVKIDQDIRALEAQLEAKKFDFAKKFMVLVGSVAAISLLWSNYVTHFK